MLSARELKSSLLPPNAQTWVNRHVLFTHGNGVVMSPVTRKSRRRAAAFLSARYPSGRDRRPRNPRAAHLLTAKRPTTTSSSRAARRSSTIRRGKTTSTRPIDGTGGVPVGGIARKVLFAWYFNDRTCCSPATSPTAVGSCSAAISRNGCAQSPLSCASTTTPIWWSATGGCSGCRTLIRRAAIFPTRSPSQTRDLNYIRNSVKIVVDGYNGSVDFYLMDAADPIAATYQRIFPGLFKPLQAMPPDLQKHIRYPEDLFRIQAQMYRAYHMDTPEVFYNREDLWQFPRKPEGGQTATMVPYYIVMRLPGEPRAEFFLMLPMVPSQRENMIAWLAARCDPPNYGKLIVYEFPKDKLVYGPFQIEARINQNTEISQQLSLWNQLGSRVIRGNVLVIPIENSILYVSPLYLRAEQGQLPELKRVIAAYGDHVVMKETLAEALLALFMEPGAGPAAPSAATGTPLAGAAADWARESLEHYNQALERLKSGDWAGFGTELDAMRALLQNMNRQSGGR